MRNIIIIAVKIFIFSAGVSAQHDSVSIDKNPRIFIGYDLGEMAFNKFQNIAGEIGFKTKNEHLIRFVYLNIKLTEAHLSSGFAGAVDGDNVKGLWHGYELLYDIPLYRFKNGKGFFYGGLSAGYHEHSFQHTILKDSFKHETATVGFDIGFRETDIFKVKGLYINFQIPVRYNFDGIEETKLGDATIKNSMVNQTISFFAGYEF